jgi:hypothetical protein
LICLNSLGGHCTEHHLAYEEQASQGSFTRRGRIEWHCRRQIARLPHLSSSTTCHLWPWLCCRLQARSRTHRNRSDGPCAQSILTLKKRARAGTVASFRKRHDAGECRKRNMHEVKCCLFDMASRDSSVHVSLPRGYRIEVQRTSGPRKHTVCTILCICLRTVPELTAFSFPNSTGGAEYRQKYQKNVQHQLCVVEAAQIYDCLRTSRIANHHCLLEANWTRSCMAGGVPTTVVP